MKVELFPVDALAPGHVREVTVGRISIAVVRKADGTFRALLNRCPHQGGALSDGRTEPLIEGSELGEYVLSTGHEVVRCPLHQWEFDVDTGQNPADPRRYQVRSYEVSVSGGRVFLDDRR